MQKIDHLISLRGVGLYQGITIGMGYNNKTEPESVSLVQYVVWIHSFGHVFGHELVIIKISEIDAGNREYRR